jgi:hypothetical protein
MISNTIHQIVVVSTLLLCLFSRGSNHVVRSFSISSPQHGLVFSSTTRLESEIITSSSFLQHRGTLLSHHMKTENDDDDYYSRNSNTNELDNDYDDDDEIDVDDEVMPFFDNATTTTTTTATTTTTRTPQHQQSVFDDTMNLDIMTTTSTEKTVDDADHVGAIGLITWMTSLCAFVFVNNFIGPWPQSIYDNVPERIWFLGHVIGMTLFGGGIILTTCVEWLVRRSKNLEVMIFWFQNVPLLDTSIVLPGLTLSILSGTGLTTIRYGGLSYAPQHIIYTFWTLIVFAVWWGFTDLTTQGGALEAVTTISNNNNKKKNNNKDTTDVGKPLVLNEVPEAVNERMLSNVISCVLVFVLYAIKVLKPGTLCLLGK